MVRIPPPKILADRIASATVVDINDITLQATKLGPLTNIRYYGAVGDGVTDDRNAFNSASTAGSEFIIQSGTYKIDSNVNITPRAVFMDGAVLYPYGSGTRITFINGFDANESQYIFDLRASGNVLYNQEVKAGWYGVSGKGDITTTGSINSSSNALTVNSSSSFSVGNGISIAGAGTSGGTLIAKIISINGTNVLLDRNASTTVSSAVVKHDDTRSLQNFIDAHTYPGNVENLRSLGKIKIPAGSFLTTDTLNLGYGEGFKTCSLVGDGPKYAGVYVFNGTAINIQVADRPAIAVNGGRMSSIEDMSIIGLLKTHIQNSGLGYVSPSATNDIYTPTWIDPVVLSGYPNLSGRYTPYCGIAIDPYIGAQPTPSYPNQPFPFWLSKQAQYNANFSSKTLIQNVQIEGFYVAIANQPGPSDSNGDYTQIERASLTHNVYGVSIGNSQARLTTLNNCDIALTHTCITTGTHGVQNGKPSISINDSEFGGCIQWLNVNNLSYGGCLEFNHCYGEVVYRLGTSTVSAIGITPVSFNNCEITFDHRHRGYPKSIYGSNGITNFKGCHFFSTPNSTVRHSGGAADAGFVPFFHFDVESEKLKIDACTLSAGYELDYLYQKIPFNATRGLTTKYLGTNLADGSFWDTLGVHNLNTGVVEDQITVSKNCRSKRSIGSCAYSQSISAYAEYNDPGVSNYSKPYVFPKVLFDGFSTNVREVTGSGLANVYASGYYPNNLGGVVGDLIYDDETGNIYTIKNIHIGATTATVTYIGENNYNGSGYLNQSPTTAGNFHIMNCRKYLPQYLTIGDYYAGSPNISGVSRPDGFASYIDDPTEGYAVGDQLRVLGTIEYWTDPTTGIITGINDTAKTITLNSNVLETSLKRRIGIACRVQGPSFHDELTLTDSIVYFPMQESGGYIVDIKNNYSRFPLANYSGIGVGTLTYASGGPNGWLPNGIDFVTGYFDCSDISEMDVGTGSFTLCGWVYPTILGANQVIAGKTQNTSDQHFRCFINSSDKLQLAWSGDTNVYSSQSAALSISGWHYVGYGRDVANGKSFVYLDGTLTQTTETVNQPLTGTKQFRIGSSTDSTDYFKGRMAGLVFFNKVLSKSDLDFLKLGPN